jgi:hypothetical protein
MLRGPSLKGFGGCLKIRGAGLRKTGKFRRWISGRAKLMTPRLQ